MREVHYFVPDSMRELGKLVGKSVGLKGLMFEEEENKTKILTYFGIVAATHTFMKQQQLHQSHEVYPSANIQTLFSNDLEFGDNNGLILKSATIKDYKPGDF